ncbi:hypothetical protein BROUX41_005737 [Berkeleyomyces rouxiae]|uniref:uncharacterized protein n=1 Tax=Berkeleyomyces rouxiae TaxID=2035830 RepID=UPI003B80704E
MTTIATLPTISATELATRIRTYQGHLGEAPFAVVDVRDTDYIGGHIKGCINIPFHSFELMLPSLIQRLASKKTVIFHCALSQQRGPSAALKYIRELERLGNAGQCSVLLLTGGFSAWQTTYGKDSTLTEDYSADIWGC